MIEDTEGTRELIYWALGIGIPLILFVSFWMIFRAAFKSRPEEISSELRVEPLVAATPPVPTDVPAATPEPAAEPVPVAKLLPDALRNTRDLFLGRIRQVFTRQDVLEDDEMEQLEEILYTSDLGTKTVGRLLEAVRARKSRTGAPPSGFDAVRDSIKQEMLNIFERVEAGGSAASAVTALEGLEALNLWSDQPAVLMVVGVNGAGKTTTIGKLAGRFAKGGRKVLVAAGDTFRAAAADQLKIWTERAAVEIFSPAGVSDPSAVAFDACQRGKAQGFDVVIIDTAGRLHTQTNLMEELKKMKRVVAKALPGAPHEVLLVLDANSGQNALQQAREYHQALGVTGVALTKLDGSAKGGVAVGLACELALPIKLIGVGEGIDDLRRFSASEFVGAIL